jgi:hypothetical protein
MTPTGVIHLLSAIYLAGILSFSVSLNENRSLRRIVRETLRRWSKFIVICTAAGVALYWIG